ncbi:MAG TPA: hypothetical protein VIS77_14140, partial [Burkholderiales bacterium]
MITTYNEHAALASGAASMPSSQWEEQTFPAASIRFDPVPVFGFCRVPYPTKAKSRETRRSQTAAFDEALEADKGQSVPALRDCRERHPAITKCRDRYPSRQA